MKHTFLFDKKKMQNVCLWYTKVYLAQSVRASHLFSRPSARYTHGMTLHKNALNLLKMISAIVRAEARGPS